MNYLAHSLLSGNYTNLVIGNFIADHLSPTEFSGLQNEIKKGVLLHRKIDSFTDSHPLFKSAKRHFYNGFEKYSGVLVDIYYDHILAANFSRYSNTDLLLFSQNIYSILEENKIHLPLGANRFLDYMKSNNTLSEYSKIGGIELVLKHLSYRIGHKVDLSLSIPLFEANKRSIEEDFFVFFDEIRSHLKEGSD